MGPWKAISSVLSLVHQKLVFVIGSGRKISFWNNR